MKTAIVIGATGMVGSALIQQLIADQRFSEIIAFTRRRLSIEHKKLHEHIIDFNRYELWQQLVKGDVLFSTLGTTLKQAGSKENQNKIDFTYQLDFAKAASLNNVGSYVLVSSASANPNSTVFYTRIKGELEREVKKLPFHSINILQPSLLVGKRDKERLGEKLGEQVLYLFNKMGLFKKYEPIGAEVVAKAMINAGVQSKKGLQTYTLDAIFALAENEEGLFGTTEK